MTCQIRLYRLMFSVLYTTQGSGSKFVLLQLSCSSASQELENRTRYPRYFQLLQTWIVVSHAVYGIIKEFGWRHAVFILQNENVFSNVSYWYVYWHFLIIITLIHIVVPSVHPLSSIPLEINSVHWALMFHSSFCFLMVTIFLHCSRTTSWTK